MEGDTYDHKYIFQDTFSSPVFTFNRSRLMPPRIHSSLEDRYSTFAFKSQNIPPAGFDDHRPIQFARFIWEPHPRNWGSNFISSAPRKLLVAGRKLNRLIWLCSTRNAQPKTRWICRVEVYPSRKMNICRGDFFPLVILIILSGWEKWILFFKFVFNVVKCNWFDKRRLFRLSLDFDFDLFNCSCQSEKIMLIIIIIVLDLLKFVKYLNHFRKIWSFQI